MDVIEPLSGERDKLSKMQLYDKQIQSNLDKINKEVGFFNDNEDCPVCGQVLDYKHVQNILKVKYDKIEDLSEGYTKLQGELTTTELEVDRLQKFGFEVRDKDDKMKECASSIKVMQRYMDKLLKEIDYLAKVEDKSEGDQDRLTHLLTERYKLGGEIEGFKNRGLYLMCSGELLKDTGIKTKIIKQYLPVMNNLVNKYLTAMDSYFNFTIDENFSEVIKSRYRDEFSYDSFSEGEKMRIDLALLFTWRAVAKLKNSASTNLLILDEVFDSSLDANGTDEFLKLLQSLGLKSNVFVISHKGDTLYEKFDSVIKFEKVQNFSKVV
jgi:DNA repair exonuclease SbcCD ATPase subunit